MLGGVCSTYNIPVWKFSKLINKKLQSLNAWVIRKKTELFTYHDCQKSICYESKDLDYSFYISNIICTCICNAEHMRYVLYLYFYIIRNTHIRSLIS